MIERLDFLDQEWVRGSADHLARYSFATEFVRNKIVLDAGTGHGYGAAILDASGAKSVVAVDIASDIVERARQDFADSNVEYRVDDCEKLSTVDSQFDLIVNFENLEHLQNPEAFLRRASELLADDGALILSTPDKNALPESEGDAPSNEFHVNEWTTAELIDLLTPNFGHLETYVQVISHAFNEKHQAARELKAGLNGLNSSMKALLKSPAIRSLLKLSRMIVKDGVPYDPIKSNQVLRLATPTPLDYPVVPTHLSRLYGTPWCNVVICKGPKNR